MTSVLRILVPVMIAAAALPLLAHALRGPRGARCAADGVSLDRAPVVRVVHPARDALRYSTSQSFCCVGCAETWLAYTGNAPARVFVIDEPTGQEIDARDAWFVRSSVIAQPATEDRMHAFASEDDARRHAEAYRGRVLTGSKRPFTADGDDSEEE